MTIIIHATDCLARPIWLTAPFAGTGSLHCTADTPAPCDPDAVQVIATTQSLEAIKDAIFMVSEQVALYNLEYLGCDVQTTPDLRRRRVDNSR